MHKEICEEIVKKPPIYRICRNLMGVNLLGLTAVKASTVGHVDLDGRQTQWIDEHQGLDRYKT